MRTKLENIHLCHHCLLTLAVLFLFIAQGGVSAQDKDADRKSFRNTHVIHFPINQSRIDTTYRSNSKTLSDIKRLMARLDTLPEFNLDSVMLSSAASPDGNVRYNTWLAEKRAEETFRYLSELYPRLKTTAMGVKITGEDWQTLWQVVYEDPNVPNRKELLAVIESQLSPDAKERRWRDMKSTFRYILAHHIHTMRTSTLTFNTSLPGISVFDLTPITVPELAPLDGWGSLKYPPEPIKPERPQREPVFAFKTNLLMPLLNAGMIVPIGKHWSLEADWYWPWLWPKKDNKDCYELLGGIFEAKYWFGRNRTKYDKLSGHAIGLCAYAGYYDLEKNFRGMQGEFGSIGLDYTYSLPLGKRKRWGNFEFSIGFGCLFSQGRTYDVLYSGGGLVADDNVVNFQYWGPTKAEISLVIPIFRKKEVRR